MPRGDKTGPEGEGPMTGRGSGKCNPEDRASVPQGRKGMRSGRKASRGRRKGAGRGADRSAGSGACQGRGRRS